MPVPIVGVNTDELVESYKSQPIIPFDERIALMKALKYTPVRDKKSQIKVGNLAIYLYLYSWKQTSYKI